jgi:hypothetical protein
MRRRLRWALSLGSAGLALASGLALAASTGAGAVTPPASPSWGTAGGITLPTGALGSGSAQLLGVYCLPGGSYCAAAGSFQKNTTNGDLPMAVSETGGTWGQATQLTLPKGAATKAKADATDIWCDTSTSCVAVGFYRYSANNGAKNNAFIATMGSGGWSQGKNIPLPKNNTTPTNATLSRISCTSPGNCGAVGTYVDKDADTEIGGYIEENGTWITSHWIVVPPDAPKTGKKNTPYGISCTDVGDCVAVGKYNNAAGVVRPFIFTSTNGTWNNGFSITLPSDAKSQAGDMNGVSCTSTGNCTAVGNYTDKSGHTQSYSVTETGGTWDTHAQEITSIAPGNSASPANFHLNGLNCPVAGVCDAVGYYTNNGSPNLISPLSVAYSGAAWQNGSGVQAPGDSNGTTKANTLLKDVACWDQFDCAGVGSYINNGGHRQALVVDTVTGP